MTDAALDDAGLAGLLSALWARGYTVIGPTARDGAVVLEALDPRDGLDALPAGWGDEQGPGRYRLRERGDRARFGQAVGPQTARRWMTPPRETLWRARREAGSFVIESSAPPAEKLALLGIRPCDLAAIGVQDRVQGHREQRDPRYAARRQDLLLIAVNCTAPAATCFCTSMGGDPQASAGFDLALTEVLDEDGAPRYRVAVGSPVGAELLAETPHADADQALVDAAEAGLAEARATLAGGRQLDPASVAAVRAAAGDEGAWSALGERCMACANCTMVCPTCFCTAIEDVTTLEGDASRERRWDSCFSSSFSYIHGGAVRTSIGARYRQWITHKLSTWHDQFGESGCVGCGRCISWCPVGIDLVAEANRITESGDGAD